MKTEAKNSNKPQKPQLNILAVIRSKIKNMEYADKWDYFFFRPCCIIFLILLMLKITTIVSVSWWLVFTPIIIPILVLWWELSKNAG
jgi:galactitol-specific phosphotransferase system IIC component